MNTKCVLSHTARIVTHAGCTVEPQPVAVSLPAENSQAPPGGGCGALARRARRGAEGGGTAGAAAAAGCAHRRACLCEGARGEMGEPVERSLHMRPCSVSRSCKRFSPRVSSGLVHIFCFPSRDIFSLLSQNMADLTDWDPSSSSGSPTVMDGNKVRVT